MGSDLVKPYMDGQPRNSNFQEAIEVSKFQLLHDIRAVNQARVSAGMECTWFGSRALMDHQMDDLRGHIWWKAGK